MRQVLLASGLALLTLVSCKKNDDNSNAVGTISATIDGKNVTFNNQAFAIQLNSGGVYSVAINGYEGSVGSSNQISITIAGTAPVTTGTYTDTDFSAANSVSFAYVQQPGNLVYGATAEAPNTATVNISQIDNNTVQGTFSGGVELFMGSGSPGTHTITSGKFNVKIQ